MPVATLADPQIVQVLTCPLLSPIHNLDPVGANSVSVVLDRI